MKYLLIVISVLFSLSVHAQSSVTYNNVTARVKVTVGDSATSTGNVGISTKNPTQKLDVNGGVRVRNLGEGIVISDADGVLSTDTNITLKLVVTDSLRIRQLVNDSTAHILGATDSGGVVKCVATCDDLRWTTVDGTQTVLRDSTDNVGIGTSNPTAKLHVDGSGIIDSAGYSMELGITKGTLGFLDGAIFHEEFDADTQFVMGLAYDTEDEDIRRGIYRYLNGGVAENITMGNNGSIIIRGNGVQLESTTSEPVYIATQFRYGSGTTNGYVLTSDADGKATWEDINTKIFTLPTYADDAAAGVGGLVAGQLYKTAAGEVRIKL